MTKHINSVILTIMTKTYLISDTHFSHRRMYEFISNGGPGDMCPKGERIRPWANSAEEGDEIIIQKWNNIVKENDRVYHLGDVAIPRRGLKVLDRLNGRKFLIRGNHDIWKMKDLLPYFENIYGTHKLDRFILSHYPIHQDSIPEWCFGNIHGHTHSKRMLTKELRIDERYINVSLEQTLASPIDFQDIKDGWKGMKKEEYGTI